MRPQPTPRSPRPWRPENAVLSAPVIQRPSRPARLWRLTRKVVQGLFIHHAFDHAATMAFYFFLGMIPLLVFVGLLVGNVVQREGAEELAAPLYRAMPRAASDLLRHELYEIADANARSIAPLSIAGFLWLTTNGVHNLMDVFEILVGARPRAWFRQRLIAVMWVLGGLLAIAAVTWTLLWINGAASGLSARHLPALFRGTSDFLAQGWKRFGILVVFIAMLSVGLAIFYRTSVRHPPGIQRKVWSGTFVALTLWALVSWGFGTYVRTIAHYAVFYGSLATVAVILLWLYLTSLALVVGAEVNAILEGMRDPAAPPSERPPEVIAVPEEAGTT
jgi:membrane protein